jgi:hypothetical protein
MTKVEFYVSYTRYDGFTWSAELMDEDVPLRGWGESLERAVQDLEHLIKERSSAS